MPQNPTRQVHALLGALMERKTQNSKKRSLVDKILQVT
jgi:hypothetical protein